MEQMTVLLKVDNPFLQRKKRNRIGTGCGLGCHNPRR